LVIVIPPLPTGSIGLRVGKRAKLWYSEARRRGISRPEKTEKQQRMLCLAMVAKMESAHLGSVPLSAPNIRGRFLFAPLAVATKKHSDPLRLCPHFQKAATNRQRITSDENPSPRRWRDSPLPLGEGLGVRAILKGVFVMPVARKKPVPSDIEIAQAATRSPFWTSPKRWGDRGRSGVVR
jgi:hypothetical protein